MKKIGITGNIASGKTTVENIITEKGFKLIEADNICHLAMEEDSKIIETIKNAFPNYNIIDNRGKINRKALGEIIFSNLALKAELESILHPYVKEKIQKFISENYREEIVFVSVPLLYEAEMEDLFDKVILVCAEENTRLERLIARNNFSKEHALSRIKSQMVQERKIKLADFIINNNSDLDTLKYNTEQVLKELL